MPLAVVDVGCYVTHETYVASDLPNILIFQKLKTKQTKQCEILK
jgi:hypothetical protein